MDEQAIKRLEPEGWQRDVFSKEPIDDYVSRMKTGPLPNWPAELLREWLYRHCNQIGDYAFIGFERLRFELVEWETARIPRPEACSILHAGEYDLLSTVKRLRAMGHPEWLAEYMLETGTWNTPIVLFDNRLAGIERLKSPFHLLEGHRRLSFVHGLKDLSKDKPTHKIWIASLAR